MEFGVSPILLSRKKVGFRDEVIHQGRIPTRQEALDYGQAILDIARPILKQVKEKCPAGIQKTVLHNLEECRTRATETCPISTMAIRTILSLSIAEPGYDEHSLEESLGDLRRWEIGSV
jgi:hypothetical protein